MYTGRCEDGALDAMADHLFVVSAQFGVSDLHALASRVLVAKLEPETVCDFFTLGHAHDNDELKDACAELLAADMLPVTQSVGFTRLSTEQPAVLAALVRRQAEVMAGTASHKRKRDSDEIGGAGGAGAPVMTAAAVKKLGAAALRAELSKRGLPTGGLKAALAARLTAHGCLS